MSRKFNLLQKAIAFSWIAVQVVPTYAVAQQVPPPAATAGSVPTTPIDVKSLPGKPVEITIPGGAVIDTTPPAPPVIPQTKKLDALPGTPFTISVPALPSSAVIDTTPPVAVAPAAERPAVAPQSTSADARATENRDQVAIQNNYMDLKDAENTFPKFKLTLEGNKVVVRGVIFRQCLLNGADFSIEAFTAENEGKPGLIIRDTNNAVRNCMRDLKRAGHTCQKPAGSCGNLELTSDPVIPESEDSTVYLFQPDPYSDGTRYDSGWKAEVIGSYEGTTSRNEKARKANAERVAAIIEAEQKTLESCRQSHDIESIGYAYEAIENLLAAGDLDEDAADRKRKVVAGDELRVLKEQASSEECHEHLDDIRSNARDLAARSPELRDKIANGVYHELAKCALKETDEKQLKDSDFAKAEEILKEAGKLGRLSKQTKESLARDREDLKRGKKEFARQERQMLMQQGSGGSRDFRKAQSQAWKSLQQDYKTCSRGARTMEMAMMCQSLPQEIGQWHQMNQMHNQVLQREYQQQWLGYNGMGMNGQMGGQMGGQFSGPFGGNQNFGGGMQMPGGPNPLNGNFAPQQPQMMAGAMPQMPQQNYPSNLWQGGAYGGGANPTLNY